MKKLNILIPTDFSDVSTLGLQMSLLISRSLPVNLHLLHVIEVNDTDPDFLEGHQEDNLKELRSTALQKFENLRFGGVACDSHIRVGKLTDQITSAVAELGIEL